MQEEQVETGALWQAPLGRKQDRDRPERADEILHQIKTKAGHREIQHRVEKHQHETQKMKVKQQKKNMIRALQDQNDVSGQAVSQTELVDRSEYERREMEHVHNEVDPHNASQSCGGVEQTNVVPTYGQLLSQQHLLDGEAPVTLDSESAIPQLERDDTRQASHARHLSNDAMESIEAHSLEQIESGLTYQEVRDAKHADVNEAEAEQHMQRSVNQCYANDEEDDVQSGTRKAEEQMRSADEAVGEVHDDSPAGQNQQHGEEEKEDGIDNSNTIGGPTDTAIDIFPGGPIGPAANSSGGHHEPTQAIETPTFSGTQAGKSKGSTSRVIKERQYIMIKHPRRSRRLNSM